MKPSVSVIVCTRNRAESLAATLASIAGAAVPSDWEIERLVVDNGSSDDTKSVAAAAHFLYTCEPRAGKGYAYNHALRTAVGDVLLFTDDDVRVPVDWIGGMCRPIFAGEADAVAGGVVFPADYEKHFAQPLLRSPIRRSWFASTELIDPAAPQRMVGANMAISRRVLEKVPEFDTRLGPGALGFHDETLFSEQLLAAGYRLRTALEVKIEHCFDLARLHEDALLRNAQSLGRSQGYAAWHWDHRREPFLPLMLWRLRVKWWLRRRAARTASLHDWDLWYAQQIAFYEQYALESRRPKRYARAAEVLS